jgi:hypothetical protein
LSRSSQQRPRSGWCGARANGAAARSASASSARRGSTSASRTCRRSTDAISTSSNSGAASCSPRSRARARSPSGPSSARATTSTLASTTSTVRPHRGYCCLQRNRPTSTPTRPVEDLVQCRPARFVDQTRPQVLLQGLVSGRRALPQHRVGLLRNVLDLYAWHSAILAPRAPNCNRWCHCALSGGHVYEAAVVTLERHDDRAGRSVAVLRDDQVGLTCTRRLTLVHVFAVQQDHDVGVLLDCA